METVNWDPNLIVDSDQLRQALSFWFDSQIVRMEEGVSGASGSGWVYAQIPIVEIGKNFRFAVYLLTGKAVLLFIQSSYLWLSGQWEQLLIGGLECKLGKAAEIIPTDFQWSKTRDLTCGVSLTVFGWFREEDFRDYKVAFVYGLLTQYQNLW